MMLFEKLLEKTTVAFPGNEAIIHKSARVTYQQLYQESCSLASFLIRKGWISSGDRVILLLENCLQYVVSYLGILGAGGIVVPVNPNVTSRELKVLLLDSRPTGIICPSSIVFAKGLNKHPFTDLNFLIVVGSMPDRQNDLSGSVITMDRCLRDSWPNFTPIHRKSDDIAQILYTSGTTGKPKGVMLSHGNLWANTESIVTYLNLTSQDRVEVILPFYYSYGNSLLLTHLRVGGTLVLSDQFVFLPSVLSQMLREKVTGFSAVPSSYALLANHSKFFFMKFESLRYMTSAGSALSTPMIKRLQEAFPSIEIFVMYGQTEASARLSYLPPSELEKKLGSVGKGIPGVNLQVLTENAEHVSSGEIGEIVAQGACVMKGYWNDLAETKKVLKDGNLYTGDLATVDEDGYIFIRGRKDNMIKCGSYRIHPAQIEEVLNRCPGVEESAILGMSDKVKGEVIVAVVVRKSNENIRTKDLLQFARRFLPIFKLPHHIMFCDHLPKTSSGKIRYGEIKKILRTPMA